MIKGIHAMFYCNDAQAVRAFMRDVLEMPHVDAGEGWLIFKSSDAEISAHPADDLGKKGQPQGTHELSFYCEDIHETVARLKGKGVVFTDEIVDQGYGLVTYFLMPGELKVMLYQAKY